MSEVAIAILLATAVAAGWLGAIGFLRLRAALDRLHCGTFVTVASGLPIAVAAFVADGLSTRAFKILALVAVALIAGAAVNQAVARAMLTRSRSGGSP